MRRLASSRALGTALALALIAGGAGVAMQSSSHASPGGVIVFASDRDKADPGEIYSLAPGGVPRDISLSLAADHGLTVAPVGNRIAFWSGRSGSDRVYLARGDGTGLRLVRTAGAGAQLTAVLDGTGGAGPLAFSADGTRLIAQAFTFAPPRYQEVAHFFAVDVHTATARPIPSCGGIGQASPDGSLIACGRNGKTTVIDLAGHVRFTLPGTTPLWSSQGWLAAVPSQSAQANPAGPGIVVDSSGATRAHIGGIPLAWSPDGRWLALARGQDLWIAGPGNLAHARLLRPAWGGGLVSFTPDSRYLSMQGPPKGTILVPLAGGPVKQGGDGGLGVWSRDGRAAYVGFGAAYKQPLRPGVSVAVFVTDTHGLNPRVVGRFPFDDHAYSELHWMPDGKHVLFLTSTTCGGKGLYRVPVTGGATTRLTSDPRDLEAPAWSPDGARIAYAVQDFACHLGVGEPIHIATRAADGSDARAVTGPNGSFDGDPAFSPDGKTVAYASGDASSGSLQTIPVSGGTPTTLFTSPSPPVTPVWSPNGTQIASIEGNSLMTIAAAGGTPDVVVKTLPGRSCAGSGLSWSPDGKQIAVGGARGIYLVTLGNPATVRLAIAHHCAEYPSFSPDGKQVAFDAPPAHGLGGQTAIMVAGTDGAGLRTLSTVPFRQSVRPAWQPG